MKYPDWQERLVRTLQAAKMRPFSWGEHDCALFAADCVQAMCGEDFAAVYRGTYDSRIGAKKALLKHHGTLENALCACMDQVPIKLLQRGDVAVMNNGGNRCAGIVWSNGVYCAGDTGLVLLRDRPLSVWRVR
ncbi:DUF6950 family protein [Limnobaculum xujianqingii]|uniref:DUF6950 family protein n=1 Tax=Limnobaculum xujianqingii TaxID=2738837 RepID=UPI001129DD9D|nr:hypothetical protein [Limnobaculum xujianqingii]